MRTMSPLVSGLAASIAVYVVTSLCTSQIARQAQEHFSSTKKAVDFALSQGFYSHTGTNGVSSVGMTCFVSDHPITFEDTVAIRALIECGATPEWKGILWMRQLSNTGIEIQYAPGIGGKRRIWGNVLVDGDEGLMDQIEALWRRE